MAFPGNCIKIVIAGSLPGSEKWSVGFYRVAAGAGVSAQELADAFVARPWVAALKTAWQGINSQQARMSTATVYVYGAGPQATDVATASFGNVAGLSNFNTPNSEAIVTTLRTANATRSGRGRMFWPATGGLLENSGLFTASTVQALVDAVAAMLGDSQAIVVSETQSAKNAVTRVDADLRPDVMRSRVDKLVSSRVSHSV